MEFVAVVGVGGLNVKAILLVIAGGGIVSINCSWPCGTSGSWFIIMSSNSSELEGAGEGGGEGRTGRVGEPSGSASLNSGEP